MTYEITDVTNERTSGEIFEEFGVEPDYVEDNNGGIEIPAHWKVTQLSEAYDGEYLSGKPVLSEIIVDEYEDKDTGEKNKSIYATLVLLDYDSEESYKVRINLKSSEAEQTNVHKSSKLYALVVGLINLRNEGAFQNYNHLKKVNLDNIRNIVGEIDDLTIKVKEIQSKDFTFNTFVIVND